MTIIQTTLADCRRCGTSFIDLNGQRMCDDCLAERERAAADDLFSTPPRRPALTARITCRVCERPAEVPILANGKLCDACRIDLDATARHIAERLQIAECTRNDAGEAYEVAWLDADEATHEQLDRILSQRETLDFTQRLNRARSLTDWKAAVALWETRRRMETAVSVLDTLRAWERQARAEIQAAAEGQNT